MIEAPDACKNTLQDLYKWTVKKIVYNIYMNEQLNKILYKIYINEQLNKILHKIYLYEQFEKNTIQDL